MIRTVLIALLALSPGAYAAGEDSSEAREEPAVPFMNLPNPYFRLRYPKGWKLRVNDLTLRAGTRSRESSVILDSPSGQPVVDLRLERYTFNPDRKESDPECEDVRLAGLEDYLREFDCSREAPAACRRPGGSEWIPPRFPWGGSCGDLRKTVEAPLGRMHIFDGFMWRGGLHYHRNKDVPMKTYAIVYEMDGRDEAVYKFEIIAERKGFAEHLQLFTEFVDSFGFRELRNRRGPPEVD
ncbi:hypothetical protein ACFL2T_04135 [Elusimicrobiota bacterium]